jgi:hypothetical protein
MRLLRGQPLHHEERSRRCSSGLEFRAGGLGKSLRSNMNVAKMAQHSEYVKQPKDHHHNHDDIEDLFDLTIHWDVSVDEPKQDSGNDESDDNGN